MLVKRKNQISRVMINLPYSLASPPDLEATDLLHLGLVLLTVILLAIVVQGSLGLGTILDGVVKLVEDGLQGILEAGRPVNGTTTGGGGASLVHPVHAVGANEGVQALGSLLNGLVEGLAGGVATLTENLVLGEEHTVDTTHQAATLTVKVRVDLLLKGGLVEVAGADGDTKGNSLLLGLASDVLEDGEGGVDATALTEQGSDGSARALGSAEDDIDVGGDLDLGEVLEDGGEAVGEVKGLRKGFSRSALGIRVYLRLVLGRLTLPSTSWGLMAGQVSDWAASLRRFMTMVPLVMASSTSNRFLPGTQPSSMASFQDLPLFRTPTMTLRPLSRRLRPWPWP